MRSGRCMARGLGTSHSYDTEQTSNAALIVATGVDRNLPPRAGTIALATAYQESQLRNIEHGDRDSLGLFQQRPSQGWGTPQQILDPIYSTNKFYDGLVKIKGYESMPITVAAQKVQRSAFPDAYADHEVEGRLFASALTGESGPELTCDLAPASGPSDPRALEKEVQRQFPRRLGTSVRTNLAAASEVFATDSVPVPTGSGATALVIDPGHDQRLGWALANWAVAEAANYHVTLVAYQHRVWNRSSQDATWATKATARPDRVVVLFAGEGS
ncbi:hypothetical protein [Devriesea agamarum]